MYNSFISIEDKLCRQVLGMKEGEAVSLIKERFCLPFIKRRDKLEFDYPNKCAYSYRINLTILKGSVIDAYIG